MGDPRGAKDCPKGLPKDVFGTSFFEVVFSMCFWSLFDGFLVHFSTHWDAFWRLFGPLKANFSQKRSHVGFVRFPKGKPSFTASKGGLCGLQGVFFSICSCHVFAIVFFVDFLMVFLPSGTLFGTRLAL